MTPRDRLPTNVIVDSGPLFDLLLFGETGRTVGRYVDSPEKARRLQEFLQAVPRRTTTPHAITEIERHLQRERKGRAFETLFRASLLHLARPPFLVELWDPVANLDPREVADLGTADAALLACARAQRGTILTGDTKLAGVARERAVAAVTVWEVFAEWRFG